MEAQSQPKNTKEHRVIINRHRITNQGESQIMPSHVPCNKKYITPSIAGARLLGFFIAPTVTSPAPKDGNALVVHTFIYVWWFLFLMQIYLD